jgi:hypothetical protein
MERPQRMRYHSHRTRGCKRITGRLTLQRQSASRGGGVPVHEAEASPTQVQEKLQMTFVQALELPAHRPPDRLCRGVAPRVPDGAARSLRSSPCRMGSLLFLASGDQELGKGARVQRELRGVEDGARSDAGRLGLLLR